jgi:hypothetical protein
VKSLLTRLKRLEQVRDLDSGKRRLKVQLGYMKKLPPEYTGERHIVTVGQLPNGHYQWEERRGPAPRGNEDGSDGRRLLRVVFVQPKNLVQENTVQKALTRNLAAITPAAGENCFRYLRLSFLRPPRRATSGPSDCFRVAGQPCLLLTHTARCNSVF